MGRHNLPHFHALLTWLTRHRIKVLLAVGVLGLGFLAGSVVQSYARQDTLIDHNRTVRQQRDAANEQRDAQATRAHNLATGIQQACAQKALNGPVCDQADQAAREPVQGPRGDQGFPGTNGKDGVNGTDGKNGRDGHDGSPAHSMTLVTPDGTMLCPRSGGTDLDPVYSCLGGGMAGRFDGGDSMLRPIAPPRALPPRGTPHSPPREPPGHRPDPTPAVPAN